MPSIAQFVLRPHAAPAWLRHLPLASLLLAVSLLTGCGSLVGNFSDSLAATMTESNDPALIAEAMPTFIVLSATMARNNPEDEDAQLGAARLYSTYASTFVGEPERQARLATTGYGYASKAACLYDDERFCRLEKTDFAEIKSLEINEDDLPYVYQLAVSWLGQIQTHSEDWSQIAQVAKVQYLLETVARLDERYDHASVHIYLGGIATLIPPALGGKPEVGQASFERAIALSQGRNLMAKVEYARRYARLVFDQELHHRLLKEVQEAPVEAPGLTLANTLAKQEATKLLADEAEYF